ncbi:hypothetical protein L1F34_002335 [Mammaliicoccus lentus]|uniref:glycosyltransferase family 2 protein n=1 Tax=Mammaliicoccus lentus TaxID=42858 RepID=UPI0039E8BBD7
MKVTIFTPTYNRLNTLKRVYKSLLEQSCLDFEWLVIDDGSTDGTEDFIENLQEEKFEIVYIKQKNLGKHIATNNALEHARGYIFTCLDSDDWLLSDSIEFIINEFENDKNLNGLVGLDIYENGTNVGGRLPSNEYINWIDLKYLYKVKGDKCYVFKTEIIKQFPFPNYGKSKHMPPSYQLIEFSKYYRFKTVNKNLKYVEYQNDGLSKNIKKHYFTSCENYCEYRKNINYYLPNIQSKLRNILLFNISWISTKLKKEYRFKNIKNKSLSYLLLPMAYFFYLYYKRRI